MNIRIGTRGSQLALWQAEDLQKKLQSFNLETEIKIIKTKGDKIQNLSFEKLEGKGIFTAEIEEELISGKIDIAVHSMKDLPTSFAKELTIGGISSRAAPNDILILKKSSKHGSMAIPLRQGAKIGTSSNRRKCWLRHFRPDLELVDIRGNVPTRIEKLINSDLAGIVLAQAGIDRLQIELPESLEKTILNKKEFIPAPAQGVVAYQIQSQNTSLRQILTEITDRQLIQTNNVERKILKLLDAGCHSPIGAYCFKDRNGFYQVYAGFASSSKEKPIFIRVSSSTTLDLAENAVNQIKSQL